MTATHTERISRREARLAEITAEKDALQANGTSSLDGTARDYRLLTREEQQIREELADLRK